ncbi:hypothetical protein [Brenneria izbisi]|uniref:Uncharacterized protein n=1 Tax=Brenneria izbisi TaxID=2939450 RepID=A0AA42C225_9GAMM|nr:hypothetical protein [Brenneria izbisi]MCV9878513.1 hypothetical protein [Brenneria izbisi]MCV9881936.1 hypothetical protein [Brenneria izbisi]
MLSRIQDATPTWRRARNARLFAGEKESVPQQWQAEVKCYLLAQMALNPV